MPAKVNGLFQWPLTAVPQALLEEYSSGKCMWFAIALHRILGWEIRATIEADPATGVSYLGHAWVESPLGEQLDIAGPKGPEDFIQFGDPVRCFTEPEFAEFLGGINEAEVERSHQIAMGLAGRSPSVFLRPARTTKDFVGLESIDER